MVDIIYPYEVNPSSPDRGVGLMQRRTILDAIGTFPALPVPDSDGDANSGDEVELGSDSSASASTVLVDVSTFTLIERYDQEGSLVVKEFPNPGDDVVAEVLVKAKWGEAGVGVTAAEARTLARALSDVADQTEQ